jgi:uncharacterized protein YoxC
MTGHRTGATVKARNQDQPGHQHNPHALEWYKKKVENQRTQLKALTRKTRTLTQDLVDKESECQTYKSNLAVSDQIIAELKSRSRNLEERNRRLVGLNNQQVETIRQAQETAFSMLGQAEWTPEPDSSIRTQLDVIERKIKNWSKGNAAQNWSAVNDNLGALPGGGLVEIEYHLGVFLRLDEGRIPHEFGIASMATKAPWLILSALVVTLVYALVIQNPFYSFESLATLLNDKYSEREGRRSSGCFDKDMMRMIAELRKCKFTKTG